MIGVLLVVGLLRGPAALHAVRPRPLRDGLQQGGRQVRRDQGDARQVLALHRHRGVSALAGIYWTLRYSSARSDNATGLELAVIAAVLLGGVSIFGGKGSIPGVVAGVLLIGTINYALRLDRVSDVVLIIVTGSLLIVSVVAPSASSGIKNWRHDRKVHRELPAGTRLGNPNRLNHRASTKGMRMESIHTTARRGRTLDVASEWRPPRPSRCWPPAARASGATACQRTPRPRAVQPPARRDQSITFIPKQLNNPYTDVVLGGGKEGATEAGFTAVNVVGPLEATASSQVSFINAETQAGTNVIVIAANDPDAVGPALGRPVPVAPRSWPSTPMPTPTTATSSSARSWPRTSH